MPLRRNKDINDVYDRIMARIEERLDQFVDQFIDRMNDMMNPRRRGDHDGRRGEVLDDDQYEDVIEKEEGFVDRYLNFQEDENNVSFSGVVLGVEEESMPVYDIDIEDVIDGEEDNMEDIVVVANDLCSSKIQTTERQHIDACEGLISTDVLHVVEDSNTRAHKEIGEASILRDVIKTGEGLISRDVFDVGEGSIPKDLQDLNIKSTEVQEQIDVSDNVSYRYDPDFASTPNGTSYWRPDLPEDEKPKLGDIFDTFDDGYNMYKVYSEKGRFNIHKSGIKRYKGKVTHKYVLCNGAGKLRSKFDINTLKEADANDEDKDGNTKRKRKTADDTMKCNYAVFGDVVSFDATFRTNKYDFIFVPFTGIDHNQKCVTFGAALLSDETEDSYRWMLKAFLKVHQKQPTLALTDQDVALRNAVVTMFPESKHGLCMWHITQKLPGKVFYNIHFGYIILCNKGSKRRKSATEIVKAIKKPKTTRKVPFKHRTCSKCGGKGHNRHKCTGKKVMKEDELQDVDEVYGSDADTASGEDNSSDEDTSADVESNED
nr:protein FAR1-related sequence 5-like [Tanacetum cinerariifolium]